MPLDNRLRKISLISFYRTVYSLRTIESQIKTKFHSKIFIWNRGTKQFFVIVTLDYFVMKKKQSAFQRSVVTFESFRRNKCCLALDQSSAIEFFPRFINTSPIPTYDKLSCYFGIQMRKKAEPLTAARLFEFVISWMSAGQLLGNRCLTHRIGSFIFGFIYPVLKREIQCY